MSIKKLFGKSNQVLPSTDIETISSDVESEENVKHKLKDFETYVPPIDFSTASNYVRFGSAKKYYTDGIERVYQDYPYDGSDAEKQEYRNNSDEFTNYIFDKEYPKSTGYAIFSPSGWGDVSSPGAPTDTISPLTGGYILPSSLEYIKVVGGPHTASGGMTGKPLASTFTGSNIYNTDIYTFDGVNAGSRTGTRESNLRFDLSKGVTTEFWLKKGSYNYGDHASGSFIVGAFGGWATSDFDSKTFTLTSTDGTAKVYVFDDDNDGATGTLDGSDQVRVQINGFTSKAVLTAEMTTAINHENGHNGKIIATNPAVGRVHLVQAVGGTDGNTEISETVSNASYITARSFNAYYIDGVGITYQDPASGSNEVIFDLWNGVATASAIDGTPDSNPGYGRLLVSLSGSWDGDNPFIVHLASGSEVWDMTFGGSTITTASIKDTWNHVAFSFFSSSTDAEVQTKFYLNGNLQESTGTTHMTNFNQVTGSLVGYIGALQTALSGNSYITSSDGAFDMKGYGKLSGSLDEFRYWKTKRTHKDIGRHWFTQVNGGANTDISNTDLGVYYKFNEGITTTTAIDSVALDYSGRISNGTWVGYSSSARNTGSAILSASAAGSEFEDPIIRSTHPRVTSLKTSLEASGTYFDHRNNAALINTIPAWIREDDEASGDGTLVNLVQIMGSYFDKLNSYIEALPKLKQASYLSASSKPSPFASHLLETAGLHSPELFVDASIMERITSRDEDRDYVSKLNDVKNLVYHNIYNNLVYIYKSKGTEKSIRNLIRCFGVDEDLIKINLYADNETYLLRNNSRAATVRKNFINFNDPDKFDSTVYQYEDPSNSNAVGFISGSAGEKLAETGYEDYLGMTAECEVIFPRKWKQDNPNYFQTNFLTSSLFGMHRASGSGTTTTWYSADNDDYSNFQIQSLRAEDDSDHVYFKLTSSASPFPLPLLTSSLFKDVYQDQKWNFSVRIKPSNFPWGDHVSGSSYNDKMHYVVEFDGINAKGGTVQNSFSLTGTISATQGKNFLRGHKRMFVGARRTDFNGTLQEYTDVKVSSLRYWASYLPDGFLEAHANDAANAGAQHPYKNAFPFPTSIAGTQIPYSDTLALHWDFGNVTGSSSDSAATTTSDSIFWVHDVSSGSSTDASRYRWLGNIINNQHSAKGDKFLPPESGDLNPVSKEYIDAARQQLPEIINSSDAVQILTTDDDKFTREHRITNHFWAVEKSMYQVISEEMINIFATIIDFNNLIGAPVNRYRQEYKDLEKLRQLWYERVRNTPDLDKFLNFYKWIDSAISEIIIQLVPASANIAPEIRNMIESHVLERSKYQTKFPTVEFKVGDPEARLFGVTELAYSWKYGHAPLDGTSEGTNAMWWKKRAERTKAQISASALGVNADRDNLLLKIESHRSSSGHQVATAKNGTAYSSSIHALRRFTKPYIFDVNESRQIHGGVNFAPNKKIGFADAAARPHGELYDKNILRVYSSDVYSLKGIDDVLEPKFLESTTDESAKEYKKLDFKVTHGRDGTEGYSSGKGSLMFPGNIVSSSVDSGYVSHFRSAVADGQITNIHNDVYGDGNEVPMQGPFTEKFVGGRQHRHVEVNYQGTSKALDAITTRPEAWRMHVNTADACLVISGSDMSPAASYPDQSKPLAIRFRDETAKRPVNIRNIRMMTGSSDDAAPTGSITRIGNFTKNYEVVHTVGQTQNNPYFKENEGVSLPTRIHISTKDNLPATTNVHTMVGVAANIASSGNLIGPNQNAAGDSMLFDAAGMTNRVDITADDDYKTIFALPRRDLTGSDSVIVSRFSAPGSTEVMTRGYLDIAAEEYSPYNALPFRNLSVRGSGSGEANNVRSDDHLGTPGSTVGNGNRHGLRTHLTRYAGLFGHDSIYGSVPESTYVTQPSYHKINRNAQLRIERTSIHGALATASSYDNWWVQHQIPRSAINYSWVSSSLNIKNDYFGYSTVDGEISGAASGRESALLILSASEYKFRFPDSNGHDYVSASLNLNTYVYEPITSSTNTLGYDGLATKYSLGVYENESITTLPDALDPEYVGFNALLWRRQGPYGYPSWRQIRGGEHPVARYQKKNNIFSIVSSPAEPILSPSGSGELRSSARYGALSVFENVSPITNKYTPITHKLVIESTVVDAFGSRNLTTPTLNFKATYGNNLGYFENVNIDNAADLGSGRDILTPHNELLALYGNGALGTDATPIKGFTSVTYKESIYPCGENIYTDRIRKRNAYTSSVWLDLRASRDSLNDDGHGRNENSAGRMVSQSSWPLDARTNFQTTAQTWTYPNSDNGQEGELQNNYTTWHGRIGGALRTGFEYTRNTVIAASVTASAVFSRRHTLNSTASVVAPTGIQIPETGAAGLAPTHILWAGFSRPGHGAAKWQAAELAGRIHSPAGEESTWQTTASNPWYNSYDDYNEELRLAAKDYQVVPEFRISDHLSYWINQHGADFLQERTKWLQMIGSPPGTSNEPQNSSVDDFFKIYTNTDFMKHFRPLQDDLRNIASPSKLTLTCQAAIKFLPYDGFYPAERALALAGQFSSSYAPHMSYSYGPIGAAGNTKRQGYDAAVWRTMLDKVFAPGIFMNSIKSGLAVDYPIMLTASKIQPIMAGMHTTDYWALGMPGAGTDYDLDHARERGVCYPLRYPWNHDGAPEKRFADFLAGIWDGASANNRDVWGVERLPPAGAYENFGKWDYRIPFEAIIEPEKYLANIDLFDHEPNPSASLGTSSVDGGTKGAHFPAKGVWSGNGDNLYRMMAHNFLAEVPEFFLPKGQFSTISSAPEDELNLVVKSGSVYAARLKLRRSMNDSRDWSNDSGRNGLKVVDLYRDGGYELPQDPHSQPGLQETFTMYSRPTAFGPPCWGRIHQKLYASGNADYGVGGVFAEMKNFHSQSISGTFWGTLDSLEGYNWSFTPPYYHGEAWVDLVFKPQIDQTTNQLTKKYTLKEIMEETNAIYWRVDAGIQNPTASQATSEFDAPSTQPAYPVFVWNGYHSSSLYAGQNVNDNAMQVDASLNIFGLASIPKIETLTNMSTGDVSATTAGKTHAWKIQPKFETPMFNFGSDDNALRQLSSASSDAPLMISDVNGSESIPRGMWHQFGYMPKDNSKGIFMEIGDIPKNWIMNHPWVYETDYYANPPDLIDFNEDASPGGNTDTTHHDSAMFHRSNAWKRTKSLTDLLGFDSTPVRLGETRMRKYVKEAIVAVPFVEEDGIRNFFKLNPAMVRNILDSTSKKSFDGSDGPSESVTEQIDRMKDYVFPPSLDFITNEDIEPIAMYIFEFKYKFDKKDLSHIWQNVAPPSSKKFELAKSTISHSLLSRELMGFGNVANGETGMKDKVQWMVFKVKQRANTNYFKKTINKNPDQSTIREKFPELVKSPTLNFGNNNSGYSYNWPYDYFSIIESVKIDAEVEFSNLPSDALTIGGTSQMTEPVTKVSTKSSGITADTLDLETFAGIVTELGKTE